jgi:PHD/YefM family antitoxin component YafN of YafNO toxin-antitoxin module
MVTMRIRESAAEYIVKNGKRKAVILPIEEYEEMLEDLHDLAVIARRRNEPTIPLAEVKRRLKKNAAVSG